jgi:hypothetical protein
MNIKFTALLIIALFAVSGCDFLTKLSEKIPCETCSEKLLKFEECLDVCKERLEESNGTIMFNKKINGLSGYKKSIKVTKEEGRTVSCICTYTYE